MCWEKTAAERQLCLRTFWEFSTYSGNIPEATELEQPGARANFSFGQGSLTANVIQVACLYSAIANGGEYKKPYLVKGLCDENMNIYDEYTSPSPVKVFSATEENQLSASQPERSLEGQSVSKSTAF